MHHINLYIDMSTTQLAHCSFIVYTDVSSILLSITHTETLDRGFINCVKMNSLEISVLANTNLHLPLLNAISVLYADIPQGGEREREREKILHEQSGNETTPPKKKKLSVSNLRGGENKDFQYPVFEDV